MMDDATAGSKECEAAYLARDAVECAPHDSLPQNALDEHPDTVGRDVSAINGTSNCPN